MGPPCRQGKPQARRRAVWPRSAGPPGSGPLPRRRPPFGPKSDSMKSDYFSLRDFLRFVKARPRPFGHEKNRGEVPPGSTCRSLRCGRAQDSPGRTGFQRQEQALQSPGGAGLPGRRTQSVEPRRGSRPRARVCRRLPGPRRPRSTPSGPCPRSSSPRPGSPSGTSWRSPDPDRSARRRRSTRNRTSQ